MIKRLFKYSTLIGVLIKGYQKIIFHSYYIDNILAIHYTVPNKMIIIIIIIIIVNIIITNIARYIILYTSTGRLLHYFIFMSLFIIIL